MSETESHHHGKNEIIIVKRHKGDHDGAHGGAWKIAYADFMTAMMAFFLIMWLVNAANEKTKAAVASYFNPIKLTDSTPAEKGLKEPAKKAQGENEQEKSSSEGKENSPGQDADSGKDKNATAGEEVQYSDADYFENPYAVIAEIAKEVDDKANVSAKGDGGAQDAGPGTGAEGGEAYRDPFDPDFWTQQVEVARTTTSGPSDKPAEITGLPGDGVIENGQNTDSAFTGQSDKGDLSSGDQKSGELNPKQPEADAKDVGDKDKPDVADKDKSKKTDKDKDGKSELAKNGKSEKDKNGKTDAEHDKLAAAEKLAEELTSELQKQLKGKIGYLAEGLVVTPAEGGVLITVSDQIRTPMFRVGSSVPTRETVRAMDEIAKVLEKRKGLIAIRGHTDARPYKSGGYDNWRLSAERAQSAYYMLKRGGIAEKRISQITGFADNRLKNPEKPLDESNRRIEILLQVDGG
jgi:chemotaxis protein MotB